MAVKHAVKHHTKSATETRSAEAKAARHEASLDYQPGFGNHFVSEAVAGALPVGRNSPQRPPLGLYAEQISGTSFTTARAENRRTWTYRIQPSVVHRPYARIDNRLDPQRAVQRSRGDADATALVAVSHSARADRFCRRHRDARRQRRRGDAGRHGGPFLCRQYAR